MANWIGYAVAAATLYGLHQIFTKLAAERISDGLGGLIVEVSAAVTIGVYLAALYSSGSWRQSATSPGVAYCILTGVCVGAGTVVFFLLFQRGAPLSAVPAVLAAGAALMAVTGIVLFGEAASATRLIGIALSVVALLLLRAPEPR